MQRLKVKKATRALVRLKHSLAADDELNVVLPTTLNELEAAFARGELQTLHAGLADVLEISTDASAD